MKVDIQDVLFWMDAIRNSDNQHRTLESFWKGQINSKVWLIESLEKTLPWLPVTANIVIYGGWNGVLASLLFNTDIGINHITSIDIDPECEKIASTVNKRQEIEGRFSAITGDMCHYTNPEATMVINTSCEHITQQQYNQWFNLLSNDVLIIVQGNNYNIPEHVRISQDLEEFKSQCNIKNILYAGEIDLPLYKRFMIIGKK